MSSKHQQIREYLLDGKSITGIIALKRFNVYRLSGVILRLRNEGIKIKTSMVRGNGSQYASYRLAR